MGDKPTCHCGAPFTNAWVRKWCPPHNPVVLRHIFWWNTCDEFTFWLRHSASLVLFLLQRRDEPRKKILTRLDFCWIYVSLDILSGNQTWLAGKSTTCRCFAQRTKPPWVWEFSSHAGTPGQPLFSPILRAATRFSAILTARAGWPI
jgi:hypothetical protein